MAVKTEYPPLDNKGMQQFANRFVSRYRSPREAFEDACRGRLEDVKTDLQVLKEKSIPVPLQPLATVAVSGRSELLPKSRGSLRSRSRHGSALHYQDARDA
jgi:hypothetical protein